MRYLAACATLAALVLGLTAVDRRGTALAQQQQWGTVKGQVVWGLNDVPVAKELEKVAENQDKQHCLSKGKIFSEELVVNKTNKGIRWAVVYLLPAKQGEPLPVHPNLAQVKGDVVMDQPCCKFEPHVVGVRKGQTLVVKNSAPVAHNVKWAGIKNPGDNKILPPNSSIKIADLNVAVFPVNVECNIHPWMKAYVYVFDHPYFVVTDENGQFEIKDVPAGKYRLGVWQEKIGWIDGSREGRPVDIKANGPTDLGKWEMKPKE